MIGTSLHGALLAAFLCLGACSKRAPREPSGVATIVLIAIDDLRVDHLSFYGAPFDTTPNLSRIAAEATVFEDYVTPSTATAATLASLLTGLSPAEHGLETMREPGRQRLRTHIATLAERLQEQGWRTVAAVSLRQFSARLSGFDRGFVRYRDGELDPGGRPLPAGELIERLAPVLEEELEREEPLFFFLHFGDLREGAALPPEPGRFLGERLAAFDQEPGLSALLAPGSNRFREVETLLARRRGSAPWKAFQKASYDAKLYELDRQLGRLIEGLQARRDPEALHLVIVGTRGCYLLEARPDAQLEGLSEGLLRTALVVRLPGLAVGRRRGIVSAQRIAPTLLAQAFADPATDLGQGLDAAPFEGELRVLSPRVRAFAEVSRSWKWIVKDGWDCEPRLVLRDGDRIVEGASMWEVLEEELGEGLAKELRERAQTVGTEIPHGGRLRLLGSAARVLVRDPSGSIRGRRSDGDGLRIRTDRRTATIELGAGEDRAATLYLEKSGAPLALEFTRSGAPIGLDRIRFLGGERLADLAVPRLPNPRAEPWILGQGPPPWRVEIVDAGSGWVRLILPQRPPSRSDVRVFAALYPPTRDAGEPMEVRRIEGGERLSADSLPGAICLGGKAPLTAEFFLGGKRLALAVEIDGDFIPTTSIRYLGRRFDRGETAIYLPPWLPDRLDWFLDPVAPDAPPLERGSASAVLDGTIWLERDSRWSEGPWDLTSEEVRFLQRLRSE